MSVWCVFVKDGGGYFLERIFDGSQDAFSYKEAQGKYSNIYFVEEWEVE